MSKFDDAFQQQLAAHYFRDNEFVQTVGTLVEPDYFENETLAALVSVQREYLQRYNACCTLPTFVQVLNRMITAKKVKIADMLEAKKLLGAIWKDPLADRQFVIDTIADFARTQAITNATMQLVDELDKVGQGTGTQTAVDKALQSMEVAKMIGAVDVRKGMNFISSRQDRQTRRAQRAAGNMTNGGITTGCAELDKQLTPHRGWGRKELSILMGGPKSGKTQGMIHFAVAAATAGFRVYYASCEVSKDIIGDRSDANISGIPLKELEARALEVDTAVEAWEQTPGLGTLIVDDFPIRTLKVSDLSRVLARYKAQGQEFDLIVVDYLGILKPETHYNEKRFGLAEIGQDLRALGDTYNAAVLTGYQTNREGAKKAQRNVTEGTDAADDFEVVRTADAVLTINKSEDDKRQGQFVLYFSEMRNAESGLRMRFSQDVTCMRFITKFEGYDN